jgi:hypothetical protein
MCVDNEGITDLEETTHQLYELGKLGKVKLSLCLL